MAVGDIFESTIEGRLHGQLTINVMHWREETTEVVGDPRLLISTAMDAGIAATMRAQLSNEWSYIRVATSRIRPLPRTAPQYVDVNAGFGAIAENSLPTSVAATITKRTQFAGRRFRGRMYVPALPISYELDSRLSVSGQLAMAAIANFFDDTIIGTSGSWRSVLYHRDNFTTDNIIVGFVQTPLRNQRRRQVGVGA